MKLFEDTVTSNIGRQSSSSISQHEDEVQDKYPDLSTYVGFRLGPQYYSKIQNFVRDFDIPNIPDQVNMLIPVFISQDYKAIDEFNASPDVTYFADQFELEVMEGSFGNTMLVAFGYSPTIKSLIDEIGKKYDYEIEDSPVYFIVSSDIEDSDVEDLDYLEMKFNEYVGFVGSNDLVKKYAPDNQIAQMMDGLEMTPE